MSANRQKTDSKRGAPRSAFKPGQSGNPHGRPMMPAELREAFRAASPAALATLLQVMSTSSQDSARVRAAETILARGYGQPEATLNVNQYRDLTDDQLRERIAELSNRIRGALGGIGAGGGCIDGQRAN